MVSHAAVLNLLRKEADQMSGYGYGMECPSCEGSGLIGGFSGQQQFYSLAAKEPMTVAQRKAFIKKIKSTLGKDDVPRFTEAERRERRMASARAFIERGGVPKPTKVYGPKQSFTAEQVRQMIDEMKLQA